jgi:hypothetical protein
LNEADDLTYSSTAKVSASAANQSHNRASD